MKSFVKYFHENRLIVTVLCIGIVVRLLFILWGAEFYFNRANIFVDGDTGSWQRGFENLYYKGVYTNNPNSDLGYFGRLPGYPLFIGVFYLIAGQDWQQAHPLIAWFQILLDVVSIFLIYKIAFMLIGHRTAIWAAALYALYPFIIVWNPVVYSESSSVFFMLAGIWFMLSSKEKKWKLATAGALLGFAILIRPQILLLIPALGLFLLVNHQLTRIFLIKALFLALGFLFTYGLWPARNYIKYNKLVLTQDLRGLEGNWSPDVIAFMQFTFSVKSGWEPQFSSIKNNKPTTWPKDAYTSYEDSLLLERAVYLSKHCGEGFSRWHDFWKEPVQKDVACTGEIAEVFIYLRERQKQENPWNFYIRVPAQNLHKAIFKSTLLYETATGFASKLSWFLFKYRTLLIILGFAGSIILLSQKNPSSYIYLGYFILLYLAICAGTSVQLRNIEIRYFLHVDILLLIPAAYVIDLLTQKIKKQL